MKTALPLLLLAACLQPGERNTCNVQSDCLDGYYCVASLCLSEQPGAATASGPDVEISALAGTWSTSADAPSGVRLTLGADGSLALRVRDEGFDRELLGSWQIAGTDLVYSYDRERDYLAGTDRMLAQALFAQSHFELTGNVLYPTVYKTSDTQLVLDGKLPVMDDLILPLTARLTGECRIFTLEADCAAGTLTQRYDVGGQTRSGARTKFSFTVETLSSGHTALHTTSTSANRLLRPVPHVRLERFATLSKWTTTP